MSSSSQRIPDKEEEPAAKLQEKAHPHSPSEQHQFLQDVFQLMSDVHPPCYSTFRVACSMILASGEVIYGMNMESCHIGGSICAERSALAQLNLRYRHKQQPHKPQVIAIYIVSDSKIPLSPGLACRELMLEFVDQDVPIVCASRGSKEEGKQQQQQQQQQQEQFSSITVTLRELYPHFPVYLHVPLCDIKGKLASVNIEQPYSSPLQRIYSQCVEVATADAKEQQDSALYKVHFTCIATIEEEGGEPAWELVTRQRQTLEFMYTLDPISIAVPQLLAWLTANTSNAEKKQFVVRFVLADQHGVLHPPSACARAHLTEHLLKHPAVARAVCMIHDVKEDIVDWKVVETSVAELVPSTPRIHHCV